MSVETCLTKRSGSIVFFQAVEIFAGSFLGPRFYHYSPAVIVLQLFVTGAAQHIDLHFDSYRAKIICGALL